MIRALASPERRLDPLRVVCIWRYDADSCAGSGDGSGAGSGGSYRQAGIASRLVRHTPPPLFPLKDVPLTGADIGGENGQSRQVRAVLRFLEDVAWVMSPGREFVVPDRSRVAQRAEVGKESRLIVAWSGRPHSPGLQMGTFPPDTHGSGTTLRPRLISWDYGAGYRANSPDVAHTVHFIPSLSRWARSRAGIAHLTQSCLSRSVPRHLECPAKPPGIIYPSASAKVSADRAIWALACVIACRGCYQARDGGLWLLKTFVPSGYAR